MPITITITDPTPEQLAALFGIPATPERDAAVASAIVAGKATRQPRKAAEPTPEPAAEAMSTEDAELAREIAADIAEAEPEPVGATQVVDAGTGKPLAPQPEAEPVDAAAVRAMAIKLAQKDTPALAKLLKDAGATKLSEVPEDKMAAFAAAVTQALG